MDFEHECLKLGIRGHQEQKRDEIIKYGVLTFFFNLFRWSRLLDDFSMSWIDKLYYGVNVSKCPTTRKKLHAGIAAVLADEIFQNNWKNVEKTGNLVKHFQIFQVFHDYENPINKMWKEKKKKN